MVSAKCPVCREQCEWKSKTFDPAIFFYEDFVSRKYTCDACTHVFMDPVPNSDLLSRYYGIEFPAIYNDDKVEDDYNGTWQKKLVEIVQPYCPTGKGFDIGCSYGGFVWNARKAGMDVHGADISETSISIGRQRGNEFIRVQGIECLDEDVGQFDFVVASHVIEHVPDIQEFIAVAKRFLKPDGYLFLRLPSGGYYPAVMDSFNHYTWVTFPMHLNYFTPESLDNYIRMNGFEIVSLRCTRDTQQAYWMESVSGFEASKLEKVYSDALADRELVLVARMAKDVEASPSAIHDRSTASFRHVFTGDDRWSCLYGRLDQGVSSLLPMTREIQSTPVFTGTEPYTLVGPHFMHPGWNDAAVVAFACHEGGTYSIESEFRMLHEAPSPPKVSIMVEDELILEFVLTTARKVARLPVMARAGQRILIATAPVEGNAYGTVLFDLSTRLLFAH